MCIETGFTSYIFRMMTLSSLEIIKLHHPTELIYSQLLQEEPLGWFKYRLSDAIPGLTIIHRSDRFLAALSLTEIVPTPLGKGATRADKQQLYKLISVEY